jgi:hypothetical protein
MRKLILAIAAIGMAAAFTGTASAQTSPGTGTVTVIHGVPDLTVDVYVDGKPALTGFAPKTVTDPIELPAGEHQIAIRPAGAAADSDPAIAGSASLPAGANASIVAHLDATGAPTLTVFVNDTSPTAAGNGRLVVRHTAAAPAVDVLSGGAALFKGLANPNEAKADVPAGTYSAAVAAAGTTAPVIGPADIPVVEGQSTIVYAIGSLEKANLGVVVQTIGGLHSAPAAVPSGTGGLASDSSAIPSWAIATAIAGLLGLAMTTPRLVAARRRG